MSIHTAQCPYERDCEYVYKCVHAWEGVYMQRETPKSYVRSGATVVLGH